MAEICEWASGEGRGRRSSFVLISLSMDPRRRVHAAFAPLSDSACGEIRSSFARPVASSGPGSRCRADGRRRGEGMEWDGIRGEEKGGERAKGKSGKGLGK